MILLNISLQNFKKYKNYNIEFKQGLIGIIGKNGSGKSTIFESILFALYGEFKNRGQKDIIRNAYVSTKEVVSISLEFEFDSTVYKVNREFRGKALSANAKLYKNEELITSGAKEVTQSIVRLTKMSKDAFVNTLFASQKELTSLSTLKNEDRKKMIRKLLGLEKIDFVEKELIEKSRELKREISASAEYLLSEDDINAYIQTQSTNEKEKLSLNTQVRSKQKDIDSLTKQIEDIKKELQSYEATKDTKQKLHSQLELLKSSINSNTKHEQKLSSEIEELKGKQKELDNILPLKGQYEQLLLKLKEQDKLKEYHLQKQGLQKEQEQLRIQYKKYTSDIKLLEEQCKDISLYETKFKELSLQISTIEEQSKQYESNRNKLLSQIGGEQKLIDDTKSKIANLESIGKTSNCPTCTRALLDEYDNVINSLNDIVNNTLNTKIKELNAQINICDTNVSNNTKEKQTLNTKQKEIGEKLSITKYKLQDLEKIKKEFISVKEKGLENKAELKSLEEYSYNENAHSSLITQQSQDKAKYEQILHLQTLLKRYEVVKVEKETISSTIKEQEVKYKEDEKKYTSVNYDEKLHINTKTKYDNTLKQKEEISKELNTININIAKIQGELNSIKNILDNNTKQLKKVQFKKDDLKDYEKIKLSLGEFKTKINSRISPRISTIASNMYASITKGKYQHIEVNNDFDFYIYDDGVKYLISRFSGGEIDLANLVLRIAISKTLAELNGTTSIGFLAFDEVFGSQDESRRMEILEAFHTIKEQYRQIFLISHEMEIKEMFEMVVEL